MLYYGDYVEGSEKILVLELAGPSLMDILEQKQLNKFSLKTILMIGIQIVRILCKCMKQSNIILRFSISLRLHSCIAWNISIAWVSYSGIISRRIGRSVEMI